MKMASHSSQNRFASAGGKYRQSTHNVVETMQKLKEERENKRASFDARHEYIMETVAHALGVELSEVEEALLEGTAIDRIASFFTINGKPHLMFFYQEMDAKDTGAHSSRGDRSASRAKKHKVFITDGKDVAVTGQCLFFLRSRTDKQITAENIHREIYLHVLDCGENGLLYAIEHMISQIFLPALQQNQTTWGQVISSPKGPEIQSTFTRGLENFVQVLAGAQDSLKERIILEKCTTIDFSKLQSPAECAAVASSAESIALVEECIKSWIKQIEKVIAESEQMRKEADNIGPRAELEHWKRRLSKFNYLLDQLRAPQVKSALSVLNFAKSKLIQKWHELDRQITNYANESKDNVKYLYTLEKFCAPLYNSDPLTMIESVPGLINAIRMIHSISQYYNTSEKMTSLFVKVTNQMVSSCKSYITDNDTENVFDQDRDTIIGKLKACIRLNEEYQNCFHVTEQKLDSSENEKKFDLSEMYIFGKFDSFVRRLNKILDIFDMIKTYSVIEISNIEGLEQLASKYQLITTSIKKKPYNILDQRKTDFDIDFTEFCNNISDLHMQLVKFIDDQFDLITGTQRALQFLQKFERFCIPELQIEEKYHKVLLHFGQEMDNISKIYNREKHNPNIPRNMPPTAGKIMWARQLFRRMQDPLELLQKETPQVLKSNDAKRIIRNYNKIAKVLLEYEVLYHRAWLRQVDLAKTGLQASLLVRHTETEELFVNFDPILTTLMKETECMARMGLEIPPVAMKVHSTQDSLKSHHNDLKHILKEYRALRDRIPDATSPLMEPHLRRVEGILEPGITSINWTSVNIDSFIENSYKALDQLKLLLDRVNDILSYRIYGVMEDMVNTVLVKLPKEEPLTPSDFFQSTQEHCIKGALKLQAKSSLAEEAVNELLDMLLDFETNNESTESTVIATSEIHSAHSIPSSVTRTPTAGRRRKKNMKALMEEEAEELFVYLHQRNIEALVKVIRTTLESLRKRVSISSSRSYKVAEKSLTVCLLACQIVLSIPNISLSPPLDEIQTGMNRVVECVLSVSRCVSQWNKDRFRKGLAEVTFANAKDPSEFSLSDKSDLSNFQSTMQAEALTPRTYRSEQGEFIPSGFPEKSNNYYPSTCANKEVNKLVLMLGSFINSSKEEILMVLNQFHVYSHLWKKNREEITEKSEQGFSSVGDYEEEILLYKALIDKINSEPEYTAAGPLALYTDRLKLALISECQLWMACYGKFCNAKYHTEMENIFSFIEEMNKKINRNVNDLDDIRILMSCLKEVRNRQIDIDMVIGPIENSYNILNKFEIPVAKEELEQVDLLKYTWEKLLSQANEVQNKLIGIQPNFRQELVENIVKFDDECSTFYENYFKNGPMVESVQPQEASDRLIIFQNRFDSIWRKYITYSGGEELFGLPITSYAELHEIRKQLALLQKLYGLYNNVISTVNGYYDLLWVDVNIEKINEELYEFQNRCRKLPRALREWQAHLDLKKKIDDFAETCPLLELMSNKSMKQRHWKRISDVTKHEFDIENEAFTLRNIMEAPLLSVKEEIEDICIAAVKEKDIEEKMKMVIAEWREHEFVFSNFKSRGELLLRGDHMSEIVLAMEDSLMILSSLMSNRYNTPFRATIQKWVHNLTNTTEIIQNWMNVQNLWVYLEAVFVGGDIAKQLPKEAKRFSNIDKSWVRIMTRAHETMNVVQCCVGDETMHQLLPHLLEQLELCQKSLTGYLEKKRLLFPRFFFVSDPVLLEILGQASNSHTIQAHLLNIFDNIKTVKFHEKLYDKILAITSREGETIDLVQPVIAEGNVEIWLNHLLNRAKSSLHGVIKSAYMALQDTNFNLIEFLTTFPSQIGLLGLQLLWTRDSTEALANAKIDKKIMQTTNQGFLHLLNILIDVTTRKLTEFERVKYETLITIHVHQRDIFNDLVKHNVKSPSDFEWLKQSRFYFDEDRDKTLISITDVNFTYQNEFLGCTERLVITPLTDRCYITLAQALGMSMGGAPAGPAGTGKTETIKDMGKALGKYVVVFNCSDQMDFRGLGRIFKGLAQSGSWGCFDEFNRIELPVLSVAAQQIAVVLSCKKERKKKFVFTDGDMVDLNPEFGIFITMNPGYAGRQELPENLKINFRTVAMMVPDRKIIIRVKLAAVGFKDNIILSEKFYMLYKLCEEQLTKQVHYDFGLRNILSVLRTLGASKRLNPEDTEYKIVMRVLRDMNLSKLIDEDESLFLSLINDLFPSITLEKQGYPELEPAIMSSIESAGLISHPPWVLKVIQLFETQRVRHGMMALGPSGAGKSECIRTLMKALTECGEPHREVRMNPKAITAPQMFGKLDVATNDWTDGIFSTLWRRTLRAKKGEHTWLVLDGPVDTIWIENLNSVLDDNKTLTLANGDRIPMAANCKIIFEPHNIDNASPATVSRNGMVFMSSSVLNWSPLVEGWLTKKGNDESVILRTCFENCFEKVYRFAVQNLDFKMATLEAFLVRQCIVLLDGLIQRDQSKSPQILKRIFSFSLMWSIGAMLELEDRRKLQSFFLENEDLHLDLPDINDTDDDTIFEFVVTSEGVWAHWSSFVKEYTYPHDTNPDYHSILVPNVDNVRTDFLIRTVAKQGKGVLLIGEQGTAKTVMVKGFLGQMNPEEHLSKALNFSSATSPMLFQRTIESYVEKRMGSTYGPPASKKMTVFIDDINMPVVNNWGDQVTNELLRQLMEMGGFYSLDKPGDFINIADMQLISAMIHPGGGRNDIPQRLKRHFSIFNCTLPSNASIDKIFSVIGCGHYCKDRGFAANVCNLITNLVPVTRQLWQYTKGKMLSTPAKFHYVFNLRDLSRIWQGMINVQSDVIDTTEKLLQLWKHECTRVIADRFVNEKDKAVFDKQLKRLIVEELEDIEFVAEERYFADFLRDPIEPTGEEPDDYDFSAPKIYEVIPTYDFLKEKLTMYMEQLNETLRGTKLDLVFFQDAMVHLLKISRIIRTNRGNALLVGVGGSGKQSLTRLASFIAGYKVFQITLTRSYNTNNLMEDLKTLYKIAGLQGKGITFIFTDNEIKDDSFLEYMNNILSSGEVSNLFVKDELDEIMQELAPIMKKEQPRLPPTNENLYTYFMNRVRENLHVVLCFSPIGEKFRRRALMFPALISGCTIDWFSQWPKDALTAVSTHFLQACDFNCSEQVKTDIQDSMAVYHDGVSMKCKDYFQRFRRSTHVTPKSYLSFIQGYKEIYAKRHTEVQNQSSRMKVGLDKLNEAEKSVVLLSKELAMKEKELEVANLNAQSILEEVTVQAQAAEKVKAEVQKVKDKAQGIVDIISADKEVAEVKLEVARPALEEAEAALKTITPTDIATVRRLGHPPHLIMRIMDCVLILFKRRLDNVTPDPEKPTFVKPSWGESLKMMADGGFLNGLQQFNKDSINDEIVELMQPYFNSPDYNLETARRVCGNVAGLCSWTTAMANFFAINKEVLPLKANLIIQQARYDTAMVDLRHAQAELDEKERELAAVQRKYEAALKEKQDLAANAEQCRFKMQTASALINGLGGEKERWTEQSREFQKQITRLVGDVLLATAFLSYAGPFNQEFRTILFQEWIHTINVHKIPFTRQLNVIDMLCDTPTLSEWSVQGLPNDELSIQNGIIVVSAARYPLLIDPQGQGKLWIKTKEAASLQVTSLDNKYFRNHLENALSLGCPLLVEDVGEELDPALDNVFEKNFIKIGSMYKVEIGDKEVDVMKGFCLYLTTKLPNPAYTPEVYAKTSIIDFTVTMSGLEDQILGRVIYFEKQELEKERTELLSDVAANKRKMKELEDNLLVRLSSTQGSLIDDESLVATLKRTKTTAEEVAIKLQTAAETEVQINSAREEYRPVAKRGSTLYFIIVEMSLVNNMYQTSLKQFMGVFEKSLKLAPKSPITSKRIHNIIEMVTYEIYKYASLGFYEHDKNLFSILMALKIDLSLKRIKHEEFYNFIKGGASLDLKSCPPKPCKWILDITWMNLVELAKLQHFHDILNQVQRNEKQWKSWFDKESPELAIIPDGYEQSLQVFHRLLLIRSWCPDRTLAQSRNYIIETLGGEFAESVIIDLDSMLAESTNQTPMLCLLSMGSDVTNQIEILAKRNKVEFKCISMGQGQEIHARRIIQTSMSQGGWALLQNCHLALEFMNELITTINDTESIHESFRLWLTTEVHKDFPIGLLQLSIKFTNDPPQGLKAGLTRSYSSLTQDQLEVSNMPQWKPLLYAVAFLHTTVQERKKYGPIGWNIPYEFNQADFNATIQFLQNHLDDMDIKKGVSWNTVRYMIGEIQYGGRVTDDFDSRLLKVFAKVWFSEAMFYSNFEFYKGYSIPNCKTISQYLEYVKNLHAVDTPEVYGLHPNADITYQTKSSKLVLDSILNIQPKDRSSGVGETREDLVHRIADDMLKRLPPSYVPYEVKERLEILGNIKPMNIFLRQEIDRMQKVISLVRTTLQNLKLAIEGTIIMSDDLRDALDSMYDARIPSKWLYISWHSSTLGFWFTELIERNNQFSNWIFEGAPNCFWITGFFNAQGFLTAMKQEVTRAHKGWALDTVRIRNEVTKYMATEDTNGPPLEGVYVHGLYLEGAAWDKRNMKLLELKPKVLFEQMPVILIGAVNTTEKDNNNYKCPIYKTGHRTALNYIETVELRSIQSPEHWILRGVALLCDVK